MVGTILPIVHGERRVGKRPVALWAYVGSSLVGASVLGAMLGYLGGTGARLLAVPPQQTLATGALLCLALAARDLGFLRLPLPQSRWQVPRSWLWTTSQRVAAVLYGAALGTGVLTRTVTSAFYGVLACALLVEEMGRGAFVLAGFGIGRALPLVALGIVTRNGDDLLRWSRFLDRWDSVVPLASGLTLAATSGCMLAYWIA